MAIIFRFAEDPLVTKGWLMQNCMNEMMFTDEAPTEYNKYFQS